jgi:hypothetical protein
MVPPPRELNEFIVGRAAENDGVAIAELVIEPGEFGDLGRANKGEILGIKEDDPPLARKAMISQCLKCAFAVFLMIFKAGLDANDRKARDFFADSGHSTFS